MCDGHRPASFRADIIDSITRDEGSFEAKLAALFSLEGWLEDRLSGGLKPA